MRRSFLCVVLASLVLPLIVQITGCSYLGYQVGMSIDRRVLDRPIPPGQAFAFGPGTRVTFHLEDGSRVEGVYRGIAAESLATYHERYRAWRSAPGRVAWSAPAPGESVTLLRRDGERVSGAFAGFSYRAIEVIPDGESAPRAYRYEDLEAIARPGADTLAGTALARLDAARALSSRTLVLMETEAGGREWTGSRLEAPRVMQLRGVAIESVKSLSIGLVAGLAVDASIVVVLAAAASYRGPFESASGCEASPGWTFARTLERPYDPVLGREVEPLYASR